MPSDSTGQLNEFTNTLKIAVAVVLLTAVFWVYGTLFLIKHGIESMMSDREDVDCG